MSKKIKFNPIFVAFFFAAGLVFVTTAWFFDRETADNNGIGAGTLDLALDEPAAGLDAISGRDWNPGDEIEETIILKNNGSLPIGDLYLQAEIEAAE